MAVKTVKQDLRGAFDALVGKTGLNPLEAKRFAKFTMVGTIGATVDFTVYNIMLSLLALTAMAGSASVPVVAGAVSFVLAVISNFLWNRYWTYPDSRQKALRWQFLQFFAVNSVGILIRIPILRYTHEPFEHLFSWLLPSLADFASRVGDNLALALAVGIVLFWNFFVNRYWTYNDVDSVLPVEPGSNESRF